MGSILKGRFGLAALLFFSLPQVAVARDGHRLVLVSIDSMRPEFYSGSGFDTPTLHRLCAQGASATRMLSVFPSVTYVNHTTMVTGVRPARHGIYANSYFSQQTGQEKRGCFESSLIQVPALWDLTHRFGLSSAGFSWPVSLGAPIDWNIPECFHVDGIDNLTTEAMIRQNSTPGLFPQLETDLPRPFPESFAQWDDWLPQTFGWVWQHHLPDLALVHVLNIDFVQHRKGPDSPETREAVAKVDRVIERLVRYLDPATTTLLIVGDHGFAPVSQIVSLNWLFLDKGWIELDGDKVRSFQVMAQSNGGSAAIYCKDPALEIQVWQLLQEHAKGVYTLVDKATLQRFETFPHALCAVSALPGFGLSGDCQTAFLRPAPRPQGQHGHLPEIVPTGLIAWGRGVEPGRDLGQIRITEVAPTVAEILGLPHEEMEDTPLRLAPSLLK